MSHAAECTVNKRILRPSVYTKRRYSANENVHHFTREELVSFFIIISPQSNNASSWSHDEELACFSV